MSILDLDKLLADISEDAPCGEDLEYDPAFGELERATQGKPEQQFGDTIVPAEEPNWKDVKRLALDLFGRTKDLRVAAHLTRALVKMDGVQGMSDGLGLFRGLLEKHWDNVHPQLDADDNDDPTMRVNAVIMLCNPDQEFQSGTTLRFILDCPIVSHRAIGSFSLHQIEVAAGQLPKPAGMDEVPDQALIDAAFSEVAVDDLKATSDALKAAVEHAKTVDKILVERVSASQAPDLDELHKLLGRMDGVLSDRLTRRGVITAGAGGGSAPAAAPTEGGAAPAVGAAVSAPQAITGEIQTRDDAVRMINKVIDYFVQNEPSSPVPLLLNRAKNLVAKSFMEIVQDLAPTGMPEVQKMGGPAAAAK